MSVPLCQTLKEMWLWANCWNGFVDLNNMNCFWAYYTRRWIHPNKPWLPDQNVLLFVPQRCGRRMLMLEAPCGTVWKTFNTPNVLWCSLSKENTAGLYLSNDLWWHFIPKEFKEKKTSKRLLVSAESLLWLWYTGACIWILATTTLFCVLLNIWKWVIAALLGWQLLLLFLFISTACWYKHIYMQWIQEGQRGMNSDLSCHELSEPGWEGQGGDDQRYHGGED